MASQTIPQAPWAPGTTVSVYVAASMPAGVDVPSGVAVTSATVSASQSVTFSGLSEGIRYVAVAGGIQRRFLIPLSTGDPVEPLRLHVSDLEARTGVVESRGVVSTSPQSPAYFGDATSSEYTASPTLFQIVKYFGQGGPLAGLLPQAALTRAKWFDTTTDDSMQADASQSIFTNLGSAKTAQRAVVANESDAVVQLGNLSPGYIARVIGHIAATEAQNASKIDFGYAYSAAAKSARDSGGLIRQHAQYHAEDQLSGIAGLVGAAWSILVPRSIHSRDSLTIGDWTGVEGHMASASIATATSVTLETGHGAGGFRGTSAFTNGQVVQVDVGSNAEVRTISTVVGDVITFTAALSNAHGQYCRVAVLGSNGLGKWYMSSSSMKTDSVVVAQSFSAIQFVITAANGAGFFQMINQTGGTVGTPSAGTGRVYIGSTKVLSFKNEDGIEAPVRTGHRITTATSLTLTGLQSGICAVTDTSAARTITLPAANAVTAGWEVVVKDESGAAGTNNITVSRAGTDDIEGVATKAISTNYGSLRVYSNGTSRWFVV